MKTSHLLIAIFAVAALIALLNRMNPNGPTRSRPTPEHQALITEGAALLTRLEKAQQTMGIATVGQKQGRTSLSLVITESSWNALTEREQEALSTLMHLRSDGLPWRIFKGGQLAATSVQ